MISPLRVWIPGKPLAQGRARATAVSGHVRLYDPKPSREWKAGAGLRMHQAAVAAKLLAGSARVLHRFCSVDILAIWPLPKGEHRAKSPPPRRWYNRRGGDADNVAKAVLDAGNGILWEDDAHVVDLRVRTVLGGQGEEPGVEVLVRPMIEDYEEEP